MELDGKPFQFALGPVEKWAVVTCASLFVAGLAWFARDVTTQLRAQADAMNALKTQQAVTNTQLATLNLQLADIPSLSVRLARAEVRIQAVEEEQKDLRQLRGLK